METYQGEHRRGPSLGWIISKAKSEIIVNSMTQVASMGLPETGLSRKGKKQQLLMFMLTNGNKTSHEWTNSEVRGFSLAFSQSPKNTSGQDSHSY